MPATARKPTASAGTVTASVAGGPPPGSETASTAVTAAPGQRQRGGTGGPVADQPRVQPDRDLPGRDRDHHAGPGQRGQHGGGEPGRAERRAGAEQADHSGRGDVRDRRSGGCGASRPAAPMPIAASTSGQGASDQGRPSDGGYGQRGQRHPGDRALVPALGRQRQRGGDGEQQGAERRAASRTGPAASAMLARRRRRCRRSRPAGRPAPARARRAARRRRRTGR